MVEGDEVRELVLERLEVGSVIGLFGLPVGVTARR